MSGDEMVRAGTLAPALGAMSGIKFEIRCILTTLNKILHLIP